ncbi:hypothetical protein HH310_16215 [Actinoplanes sp. TBRC 11911]|uniref:hypothetical protein n=1 Tax=Actinoplanes sp. TBRC 11911 TaxID=2729386 RepID=UPI00145C7AE9|nr:hypothetical protein [Actinoplanes sp. TBRC 11911]NMO52730.1 hypothetical protein [Actinoplanes sp. TBRC 11911]
MGDDSLLDARALVPAEGGEWNGLLFDNPSVGVPPALTWTFRIPFAEVHGEAVALDVEWLPVPTGGWQVMSGLAASSGEFAEPAEASVRFQGHHRYDTVELRVLEQDGPRIRVAVTVAGDLDQLGPEQVSAEAWLRFTGIFVQLSGVGDAASALARLGEFTDPGGLAEQPDPRGIAYLFGAP